MQDLRSTVTARRAGLTNAQIATAAALIASRLWRLPVLARSRRVACYFAVNGEVDCSSIVSAAWKRKREVFLPVLRGRELVFAPVHPDSEFIDNRFGIPEPVCAEKALVRGRDLDVVLTPLVAFDSHGTRLGMGGGYYDRTFRFLNQRSSWTHPHLIGLAYAFQETDRLPVRRWDVPLQEVVTENGSLKFG
jgi:5-formyltetrahydrofolate cyclo-ligase